MGAQRLHRATKLARRLGERAQAVRRRLGLPSLGPEHMLRRPKHCRDLGGEMRVTGASGHQNRNCAIGRMGHVAPPFTALRRSSPGLPRQRRPGRSFIKTSAPRKINGVLLSAAAGRRLARSNPFSRRVPCRALPSAIASQSHILPARARRRSPATSATAIIRVSYRVAEGHRSPELFFFGSLDKRIGCPKQPNTAEKCAGH